MNTIETQVYARAALAGNPSDGYYGKTLSFCFDAFAARVVLTPSEKLAIVPDESEFAAYESLAAFADDVRRNGYYGGLRLIKASLKKFFEYSKSHDVKLHERNFTISYATDIPRQVGLAGSSAIITATWRALMRFYELEIAPEILANWTRATEQDELGISGGLQDRVAQSFGGLVFMDFNRAAIERDGVGAYEPLDARLLPPLYLAYATRFAEESGVIHNDLKARWQSGDDRVHDTMRALGEVAQSARDCLVNGENGKLGALIDRNFELRRAIIPINASHLQMVEIARNCGASAHFAGSGGAIVGTFDGEPSYALLQEKLGEIGCRVIQPQIAPKYQ